jgi:NTE family protein
MKNFGLVLGGGGAKGICHLAFLDVLDELGIRPQVISGTSIGALIGAFYAAGVSAKELRERYLNDSLLDTLKLVDISLFGKGLIKGDGFIKRFKDEIGVTSFDQLEIPLKVIATDFWSRKQVVFDEGDLAMAVRSSISLPVIFEPVQFGDQVLIDGGAVNPLPYDVIADDCPLVIAIDVSGRASSKKSKRLPKYSEIMTDTFQIMMDTIVTEKGLASKVDLYVKPDLFDVGIIDFHKHKEILASVESDVAQFKLDLKSMLKSFSFFK